MTDNKIRIAGLSAGIVFGAGLLTILVIPGLGGSSTTKAFNDFYGSSAGRRDGAVLLSFVLLVGCWLLVWLHSELRTRLTTQRSELAGRLGLLGVAGVLIGAGVELGPAMVQTNSDNSAFVGIPVAHAFAQAGASSVVMGLITLALSILLFGLDLRRSTVSPRWLGIFSIVIGVLLFPGSLMIAPAFLVAVWAIVVGLAV